MMVRLTPAVKWLLISCVAIFVIQQSADQFFGGNVTGTFGLSAGLFFSGSFWQILTYAFLHGDVFHLLLNMLMMVFISSELEQIWGTRRFLRFYAVCVVAAGFAYLMLQLLTHKAAGIPMVGASGGIYGLLMAYGLIFGERILLFALLFPMKARHFIWLLVAVEFLSSVFSGRGALSSVAHFGGMIAGLAMVWGPAYFALWREQSLRRARKKDAARLKLVVNNEPGRSSGEDESSNQNGNGPKIWH